MKTRVVLLITAVLLLGSIPSAQSFVELLQQAIYTQETLGDVDAAIRLYRQIIAGAPPSSDIRRQAQRRLQAVEARRRNTGSAAPLATFDGRTYRHIATGMTFDVPEGWTVEGTGPSSDDGEMVELSDSKSRASIAIWMKKSTYPDVDSRLDASPRTKASARVASGFEGYRLREGSVQRTVIGGQKAMVGIADYIESNTGLGMSEYMTWIYTPNSHIFFFSRVRADELDRLKPQFDAITQSAIVP